MAYVAVSKDLISRVNDKINHMQNLERAGLPSFSGESNTNVTDLYHRLRWGDNHVHLLQAIPRNWLVKGPTATIELRGGSGEHIGTFRFNAASDIYFDRPDPNHWYYHRTPQGVQITVSELEDLPETTPGRQEMLDYVSSKRVVSQIDAKWNGVRKEIVGFLGKCKSLNEAVKLYPAVRMYIDNDDLDRLDKKVERAKPQPRVAPNINTDELTAAAVAARLLGFNA